VSRYGFHRVIEPKGVVPQAAIKVDNTPRQLHPSEKLIQVKLLNLDSTSTRQITESGANISDRVREIVDQRGKMHNPVTNSGGVLLAEYNGQAIVPWASLSAIPLYLDSIGEVHGQQIDVVGTGVLFESYFFTAVPDGMDWRLAATALDIASLPVQIRRALQERPIKRALIIGCGNAGIAAMATIKKYSPHVEIIGVDVHEGNFARIKAFGLSKNLGCVDAANAEELVNFVSDCDLVVNCVNVPNTEASSVLATKDHGLVIFFSMATKFDQASLATDATGKDVVMQVASGIAKGEDDEVFGLMRDFPNLLVVTH
jgi:L-erythro-3,5-diaminohexanoate dehydrogenase